MPKCDKAWGAHLLHTSLHEVLSPGRFCSTPTQVFYAWLEHAYCLRARASRHGDLQFSKPSTNITTGYILTTCLHLCFSSGPHARRNTESWWWSVTIRKCIFARATFLRSLVLSAITKCGFLQGALRICHIQGFVTGFRARNAIRWLFGIDVRPELATIGGADWDAARMAFVAQHLGV